MDNAPGESWLTEETFEAIVEILSTSPVRKAADKRGHSELITFRVTPSVAREISIEASKSDTPYLTRSDLLRDCVHRGLGIIRLRGNMPAAERALVDSRNYLELITGLSNELTEMIAGACKCKLTGMHHAAKQLAAACKQIVRGLSTEMEEDMLSAMECIFGEPVIELLKEGKISDELLAIIPLPQTAITRRKGNDEDFG